MKIAIAQINAHLGDFPKNTQKILQYLKRAREQDADLVVFPELAVCGYPPRDLLNYRNFVEKSQKALREIVPHTQNMKVVCGFVSENDESTQGKRLFNSAAIIEDGIWTSLYNKRLLPNYDIFDESRYFEAGASSKVLSVGPNTVGVTICEDIWNESETLERKYRQDPLAEYEKQKVDVLVNIAASPFCVGRAQHRVELFRKVAKRLNCQVVFCNQVGGVDGLIFDGSSFVVDSTGKLHGCSPSFSEDFLIVDTQSKTNEQSLGFFDSSVEQTYQALVFGLRDYFRKCGFSGACLGLSGGIDSAVAAAIAAEALGGSQIYGACLPTRFTSNETLKLSEKLASNLGVEFRILGVETVFSLYENLWREWFHKDIESVANENLQPRIRMSVLMALANERNHLLINTSNKSEIAVGYATLYGDSSGAIGVLGDVLKTDVYELAKYINRDRELIPNEIIDRPPTAELREGQLDEQSLPPYETLDSMIRLSIEQCKSDGELVSQGFSRELVSQFRQRHAHSEYKRAQLPPVLRISRRAFGEGRRLPISCHSQSLS